MTTKKEALVISPDEFMEAMGAVSVLRKERDSLKALAKRLARELDEFHACGACGWCLHVPPESEKCNAAQVLSAAREMLGEFDE